MSEPPAIEARFAGRFGDFSLDVDLSLPLQGTTALFGPSASGKTSLLRCLAGLVRPAVGRLVVGGAVWQDQRRFRPPHRRPVGYVFQEATLFPHLTVAGNLAYGARRRGGIDPARLAEITGLLALEPLLTRTPAALSGGERQRVAIGRALLARPALLLLDEPLTGLDQASRHQILGQLDPLLQRLALPTILVSHDPDEVIRLADRVALIEQGRIRGVVPVEQAALSRDLPFLAAAQAGVRLDARVIDWDPADGIGRLAVEGGELLVPGLALPAGERLRVRVGASDIALSREPAAGTTILNHLPARVIAAAETAPAQMTVTLRLGADGAGATLLARVTRRSWQTLGFAVGEAVWILIKAVRLTGE